MEKAVFGERVIPWGQIWHGLPCLTGWVKERAGARLERFKEICYFLKWSLLSRRQNPPPSQSPHRSCPASNHKQPEELQRAEGKPSVHTIADLQRCLLRRANGLLIVLRYQGDRCLRLDRKWGLCIFIAWLIATLFLIRMCESGRPRAPLLAPYLSNSRCSDQDGAMHAGAQCVGWLPCLHL